MSYLHQAKADHCEQKKLLSLGKVQFPNDPQRQQQDQKVREDVETRKKAPQPSEIDTSSRNRSNPEPCYRSAQETVGHDEGDGHQYDEGHEEDADFLRARSCPARDAVSGQKEGHLGHAKRQVVEELIDEIQLDSCQGRAFRK